VSTFSAAMERRGGRDRLRLRVRTIRGPADPRRWAARVRAIPVVDDLVRRGRLELDILPGAAAFPTTGTAKRRIADRRDPARSAKPLDIPRSGR